jgi:DNA-binding protein H-NS
MSNTLTFNRRVPITIAGRQAIAIVSVPSALDNMRLQLANQRVAALSGVAEAADKRRAELSKRLDAVKAGSGEIKDVMSLSKEIEEVFEAMEKCLSDLSIAEEDMHAAVSDHIREVEVGEREREKVLFRRNDSKADARPWSELDQSERVHAMRQLDRAMIGAVIEAMGGGASFEEAEK